MTGSTTVSPDDRRESLLVVGHRTRLGILGEQLALECLIEAGFANVIDLNKVTTNNVFADIRADRDGIAHIISVKTRNRLTDRGKINPTYNLLKINARKDKALKAAGVGVADITAKLHEELAGISAKFAGRPSWVTVAIDAAEARYSAYFGLVADLGMRRSVPMTHHACHRYELLAHNRHDGRITPDLSNV